MLLSNKYTRYQMFMHIKLEELPQAMEQSGSKILSTDWVNSLFTHR